MQCIAIWDQLKASGYEGTFVHPLFTDLLLKPMAGTVSSASFNPAPNPGLTQMEQDLDDAVPGTKVSSLNAASYFAADMFIQALKKVGKKNITPEKVQQALARQTWQIDGFAGPTRASGGDGHHHGVLHGAHGRCRRHRVERPRAVLVFGQGIQGQVLTAGGQLGAVH